MPVLELDGRTLIDSSRILVALEEHSPSPPLFPADPAERARAVALEEWLDEELGPHLRRASYFHLLADPAAAVATIAVGESAWTQLAYRVGFPVTRALMRRAMGIDATRSERSRLKAEEVIGRLAAEIRPSGYLVGDAFSVADLTAALLAPLLQPEEFPYRLPPFVGALAEWRTALLRRSSAQWVLDMYRRHRSASCAVEEQGDRS